MGNDVNGITYCKSVQSTPISISSINTNKKI